MELCSSLVSLQLMLQKKFPSFSFIFFFFSLCKEGKARVEKAVYKKYLNPCYNLNALQSFPITEQLEIQTAVLKIYALHI